MNPPRIGLTCGDPGGIGPEILLKALSSHDLPPAEYLVFAPPRFMAAEAERLQLTFVLDHCRLVPVESSPTDPVRGRPDAANGLISFEAWREGVVQARKRTVQALVTAPISKLSWRMADIPWAGHTDYLERSWPQAIMAFFSERLNLALFTHHLPLREALARIKKERLLDFLCRLAPLTRRVLGPEVRLLCAGLNPHAGEGGLLGGEEQAQIVPAVEEARGRGAAVDGPFPPDIVCRMGLDRPDRLVVCLYHDQGLIAFKLIAFETGVNVTLGLPFVRTSPDHGTAFDIAGRNEADPASMLAAIRWACRLAAGGRLSTPTRPPD
jgi:4-hydroxythreonine-4-phosphate dehydrogenase